MWKGLVPGFCTNSIISSEITGCGMYAQRKKFVENYNKTWMHAGIVVLRSTPGKSRLEFYFLGLRFSGGMMVYEHTS